MDEDYDSFNLAYMRMRNTMYLLNKTYEFITIDVLS